MTTVLPRNRLLRLVGASWRQSARTPRCPDAPRLDGALAVVTGATAGIGFEIARGLARRGAELIVPCRSRAKGEAVVARVSPARAHVVDLDLEDLDGVAACADAIAGLVAGRSVDILVENAGVWPRSYTTTRQGCEIAFGVNVLAHFALRRALQKAGLLRAARVVVLTGDIYVLESDCTPDFVWRGARGGMRAYCRSKLGNLWIAAELQRRFPMLAVHVVHPGVVATGLGGSVGALADTLRRRVMIDAEQGAQMPIWCATQPGIERGGYYHNTYGRVELPPDDPARDAARAERLWETCEALVDRHIRVHG
jgi:NAD(P)-dependent dehydrogenase (short-subunit alcohol dehydrogenase family)